MDNYETDFSGMEQESPRAECPQAAPAPKKPSPFADSPYEMPAQYAAEPAYTAPVETPKPKKGGRKVLKSLLSYVLVVALIATGCFVTARSVNGYWENRNEKTQAAIDLLNDQIEDLKQQIKDNSHVGSGNSVSGSTNVSSDGLTPGQLYAKCVDSVVAITVEVVSSQGTGHSSGSGFIISEDGYIISNYHVVEDGTVITITTHSGDEYTAKVIGYDDTNDLALLKAADATGLKKATLGSSDALIVGDQVVAIGNPLGELSATLTVGYVSGKDRTVTTTGAIINMIQTDAAINPGNSGGPLFNMKGEVVGITTAKYSGTTGSGASIEGIGFAIPIDDVVDKVQQIKDNGYVSSPYMGVTVDTRNDGIGAYVVSVEENSGAAKAGIRPGDIIVELGGKEVDSVAALTPAVKGFKVGDTTTVVVYRSRKLLELSITFGERPHENANQNTNPEIPGPSGDMPSSGDYKDWFDYFFGDGNG